jgi:hypothetical protein
VLALLGCAEGRGTGDADQGGARDSKVATEGGPGVDLTGGDLSPPGGTIYVASDGSDSATCGSTPKGACRSITRGIIRALNLSPPGQVRVAAGDYYESVSMMDRVSVLGGYTAGFSAGPGKGQSVIHGAGIGGRAVAVSAENLTRSTELSYFTVKGPDAKGAGSSGYGIYVEDSPAVVLKKLVITAGNGAAGAPGAAGTRGVQGNSGGAGIKGGAALLPVIGCGTAKPGGAGYYGTGAPGALSGGKNCSDAGGRGGKGEIGLNLISGLCPGENGKPATGVTGVIIGCGSTSHGKGGGGGTAGQKDCDGGTTTPARPGSPGCPGKQGAAGTAGQAGADIGKPEISGTYAGAAGGDGGSGGKGGSGGGGGGGGGFMGCSGLLPLKGGGGGGGGGSGGCGGSGGRGGGGGGGSFGIYIVKGYASQRILDCTISTGSGGSGGAGGQGGPGGTGGPGGSGGAANGDSGRGGDGGSGAVGGQGGGGGGGGGGPAIGIFIGSGAKPNMLSNSITPGTGGSGGAGGEATNAGTSGREQMVYLAQ